MQQIFLGTGSSLSDFEEMSGLDLNDPRMREIISQFVYHINKDFVEYCKIVHNSAPTQYGTFKGSFTNEAIDAWRRLAIHSKLELMKFYDKTLIESVILCGVNRDCLLLNVFTITGAPH